MLTLVLLGWGQENPAFRQIFTSQFVPEDTKEQIDWWNEMQRVSASPENAARFIAAVGDIDVIDLLAKVTSQHWCCTRETRPGCRSMPVGEWQRAFQVPASCRCKAGIT